jgi:hypothetical protein
VFCFYVERAWNGTIVRVNSAACVATVFIRAALLDWLVNQQFVLLGTAAARAWPSGRSREFGVGELSNEIRCHEAVVGAKYGLHYSFTLQ